MTWEINMGVWATDQVIHVRKNKSHLFSRRNNTIKSQGCSITWMYFPGEGILGGLATGTGVAGFFCHVDVLSPPSHATLVTALQCFLPWCWGAQWFIKVIRDIWITDVIYVKVINEEKIIIARLRDCRGLSHRGLGTALPSHLYSSCRALRWEEAIWLSHITNLFFEDTVIRWRVTITSACCGCFLLVSSENRIFLSAGSPRDAWSLNIDHTVRVLKNTTVVVHRYDWGPPEGKGFHGRISFTLGQASGGRHDTWSSKGKSSLFTESGFQDSAVWLLCPEICVTAASSNYPFPGGKKGDMTNRLIDVTVKLQLKLNLQQLSHIK